MGLSVQKATSLSSTINQSVSQSCKREKEEMLNGQDPWARKQRCGGSSIPDRSLMARLNVAPGITTDAYVHLQTVISAGSHATLLDHRLCLLPVPVPCVLCLMGYLHIMYGCMCYILSTD
jgi:hypothetical protein